METTQQTEKKGAILVVEGVVRIYEQYEPGHPHHKFRIRWKEPGAGEVGKTRTKLDDAVAFAKLQAKQILAGTAAANRATPADLAELVSARFKVAKHNSTLLGAVDEWCRARDMVGFDLIEAVKYWLETRPAPMVPTKFSVVIDRFIAHKIATKRQGERTYRSKLNALLEGIGDHNFHKITATMVTDFVEKVAQQSVVTANDLLKRMKEITKFAQFQNYAPRLIKADLFYVRNIQDDEDKSPDIITPEQFKACLEYIAKHHPHHLPGVVLAGFCGVRQDEIHGKRPAAGTKARPAQDGKPAVKAVRAIPRSKMPRQLWEDIHIDDPTPYMNVTVAKKRTLAYRPIPLCPAAVAWLKLCYVDGKKPTGYIVGGGAMERVRDILQYNHVVTPLGDNVFRHSRCSYRYKLVGARTSSEEAGHTEKVFIKHYRAHAKIEVATAWFDIMPT